MCVHIEALLIFKKNNKEWEVKPEIMVLQKYVVACDDL